MKCAASADSGSCGAAVLGGDGGARLPGQRPVGIEDGQRHAVLAHVLCPAVAVVFGVQQNLLRQIQRHRLHSDALWLIGWLTIWNL